MQHQHASSDTLPTHKFEVVPDPAKEREHENWTRVSYGWAKHDERLRVSLGAVSERMIAAVDLGVGHSVLDIASGTGEPALLAAERVGRRGRVLGIDFVKEMLVFARGKAAARGLDNIDFRLADAEVLEAPPDSMDAVLIRFGLMFMPDPGACLSRAHSALRSGGRIAAATWAGPEANPWAAIPLSVLERYIDVPTPPPGAPHLFAFANPARLRTELEVAGFADVVVDEVEIDFGGSFDDGASFIRFIADIAGPVAGLLRKVPHYLQARVLEEMADEIEARRSGERVVVPGATWVAHAHKP